MGRVISHFSMGARRKSLRNDSTFPEQRLWFYLRNRQLHGIKFRRQSSIGPYIVDFYSPTAKLVIEIDGDSHALSQDVIDYDATRQRYIESQGFNVIRFTNRDISDNIDGVLERISAITAPPLAPPLQGGE